MQSALVHHHAQQDQVYVDHTQLSVIGHAVEAEQSSAQVGSDVTSCPLEVQHVQFSGVGQVMLSVTHVLDV